MTSPIRGERASDASGPDARALLAGGVVLGTVGGALYALVVSGLSFVATPLGRTWFTSGFLVIAVMGGAVGSFYGLMGGVGATLARAVVDRRAHRNARLGTVMGTSIAVVVAGLGLLVLSGVARRAFPDGLLWFSAAPAVVAGMTSWAFYPRLLRESSDTRTAKG